MWIQAEFKGGLVYAECSETGEFIAKSGRVAIRYQNSDAAKIYQASAANLKPHAGAQAQEGAASGPKAQQRFGKAGTRTSKEAQKANAHTQNLLALLPDDTIICYTDGASRGNPGMAASAYLIEWPKSSAKERQCAGLFLGQETNNVAELTAVKLALTILEKEGVTKSQNVAILTDSKYVCGLFMNNWTAKANGELVAAIRTLLHQFPKARFHWVPGHAGVAGNEIVDQLANQALDNAQVAP